ncbi:MAG: HepT-like ribonuclease domain-containing protein [Acidobacteriota bacterium]
MRQPDDRVLLKDMVDHARRAMAACQGKRRENLETDPVLAAALERFIEVAGEAASKVSPATQERLAEVRWAEIIGMRNRLVHGYASVDHDVVWTVVTRDLPVLVAKLEPEIT